MITADELKVVQLFADVPDHERETIASRSADIHLGGGEWLIHQGESPSFFAVLAGTLEVTQRSGGEDLPVTTFEQGEYFGEVPLLLRTTTPAGVRAVNECRIARLNEDDFRELIVSCDHLREQIVRKMAARVSNLAEYAVAAPVQRVTITGDRFDIECYDVRDFLARNHIPFTWVDPADAPTVSREATGATIARRYPIVTFPDGAELERPSARQIADKLGLRTSADRGRLYDVIVVGSGPAGLAAGVYGASEGLATLLIERAAPGGQAGSSSRIENYLGFPHGLSGDELSGRAWEQAKRFGAEMLSAREVKAIEAGSGGAAHTVVLDDGERVKAKALVLAMGVAWRELKAEGIAKLTGRGVYYGAARTEAPVILGKDVYLVGGGNSAGQAAMYFANYAKSVTLLIRGASLASSMSQYLIDQLNTKDNVHIRTHRTVVAARGKDHLEALEVEDTTSGQRETLATAALFILIGADPATDTLPASIVRDSGGYVCTGRDVLDLDTPTDHLWPLRRDPFLLETSVPGIFAAGDVRHGSIKRVAAGVGEGSMSIAFIHQYLAESAAPTPVGASAKG
jgi:thioredoxin reductase (NADPH)